MMITPQVVDPSFPGAVRHLIEADLPDLLGSPRMAALLGRVGCRLLAQAAGRARHVFFRLQQQTINPCWSRPSLAAGVLV